MSGYDSTKKPVKPRQEFQTQADATVAHLRRTRMSDPVRFACPITPQLAKPITLLTREHD
jgi:hypothetical protein